MQVRIEEVSPVERKLIVEVPWSTVEGRLREAYRELGKSVQLKGFRKGKVPKSVLERMFGKRVRAEVAGQLVRESFVSAATEHNLEAVSEPVVQDEPEIKKGEPFAFEAIVEVKGDVEAKDYEGMELTRRKVEISDDAVQQALEQVQREHTELRPVEGRNELQESDFVALSVKGKVGEHEVDKPQLTVDLGDREKEPLPGLVDALIGLPLDAQDHEIRIEIPEDYREEEIAGETAELTVSVLDTREKDVPEIDDELAKDTEEAETLDELKQVLRKKLEERMEEEVKSETRDQALKELIKRNPIQVASSLVDRAAQMKTQRFQQMLGMQGASAQDLGDEILDKLREGADDDVRGQLLMDAVAKQESIEVSDDELMERVGDMAKQQGQAPARLRAEMERDGRLENLRFQILQEKVLDLLVEKAHLTEVEAKPEAEEGGEGAESAEGGEGGEGAGSPDQGEEE